MTGMRATAAEYLALVLPGTPEQAAAMVGLPAAEVAALRSLPNVADELAVRRARLNIYTDGTDPAADQHRADLPTKLGESDLAAGRRPARQPVTHHVHAGADHTGCCWRRVATLPELDRVAADRSHATCGGAR